MNRYDQNMSPSQFAGRNIGGGGYMPGSPAPGAMPVPQTQSPTRARVNYDVQCLLPLSIKQILNAEPPPGDQNLTIDGREVYHITVMGWVEEIDVQTTHTTFILRDASASIPVKMWSSDSDPNRSAGIAQIGVKHWVRVIGRIQSFRDQYSITGFNIRKIENFNEITFHILEVIHAHLKNTEVAERPPQPNFNSHPADVHMSDAPQMHSQPMGYGSQRGMSMGSQRMGGSQMHMSGHMGGPGLSMSGDRGFQHGHDSHHQDGNDPNLSPIQREILKLMRGPSFANVPEGVHVEIIFNTMRGVDRNDIRQAIELLSNEGLVYSTLDDEHFKATGN